MVELAAQVHDPRQGYICYWMAFNVIYTALAAASGLRPEFSLRRNGTRVTRRVGAVKVTQVHPPSESAQINAAFGHLSADLKHQLIVHEDTPFFVYRKPTWRGTALETDTFRQRLNGVINVGHTIDPRYPVWSPIDVKLYRQYTNKGPDDATRDILARQVLDVLCTVRGNLLYGGEPADAESSAQVVGKALPLLAKVVFYFL
jgi:hypothetical protein